MNYTDKFIMGTVQLGKPYGINNTSSMPSKETCFAMLDAAYNGGISALDTAAIYGESEALIGEYCKMTGNKFHISTKMNSDFGAKSNEADFSDQLICNVKQAQQKLCCAKISCYYLHGFRNYHGGGVPLVEDKNLVSAILRLKSENLVENIGVSIYIPDELEDIIENYSPIFDIVQIPFNIFSAWQWMPLFARAKEKNIKLYARSVFLQGLFFKNPDDPFVQKIGATKPIDALQHLAKSYGRSMYEFCLDFATGFDGIDKILFGCETIEQLQENLDVIKNINIFDKSDLNIILNAIGSPTDNITNPMCWEK